MSHDDWSCEEGVNAGGCEGMMCTAMIVLSIMRDYIRTIIVDSLIFCLVRSRRREKESSSSTRTKNKEVKRRGRAAPQNGEVL